MPTALGCNTLVLRNLRGRHSTFPLKFSILIQPKQQTKIPFKERSGASPHNEVMKNSKKNNRQSNATIVRNAKNTLTSVAHTWNQVAKAYQMSVGNKQGKDCLKAMNTLGVHVQSLSALKASDFFAAWWGGLKTENGTPMMWKAIGYLVEVGGKDYTLYTLGESGDYKRVSVYEKREIISETDKNFDKKKHIAPTTDVVASGLAQCALATSWVARVAKATEKATALTEGYVNVGTAQKPEWTKVIRKDNKWMKTTKSLKKVA